MIYRPLYDKFGVSYFSNSWNLINWIIKFRKYFRLLTRVNNATASLSSTSVLMVISPTCSVSSWYSGTVRFPVFFPPLDADTLKLKIKHAAHAIGRQAGRRAGQSGCPWRGYSSGYAYIIYGRCAYNSCLCTVGTCGMPQLRSCVMRANKATALSHLHICVISRRWWWRQRQWRDDVTANLAACDSQFRTNGPEI